MASKKFTKNFDGEVIKENEVMIPFEYTDLDAEQVVNPECIRTLTKAGRKFRVIYKAVPMEWEKKGRSAFNLVQNEQLGHYDVPNSVSMNQMDDEFGLALETSPSVEDKYLECEELNEMVATFVDLVSSVIEKSPKLGYAVMLLQMGVKGEAFYGKMRLSRDPANRIRKEAEIILKEGLANLDVEMIKGYKNKYNEIYKEEAYALLKEFIEKFR